MAPIDSQNDLNTVQRGTLRRGNFELGYTMEGSGRPALVIGSSLYYPRTFSEQLREELKLIFVDHRGFAPHQGLISQSDYELDVILEDVEALRQHLGVEQVVIVGHSGHGYMALVYAKKYPHNVSHVALIATAPSHSQQLAEITEQHFQEAVCPQRKAKLEKDLHSLGGELAAAPDKRFITFCIRLGARSWYDFMFDAAPLWQDVHVNMEIIDYLWGEVFRDIDITAGLEKLNVPVFLALGRFDYLVAPYFTWQPYRSQFQDLTVRVFDQSSHTPQMEQADLFDSELLDWLAAKIA